MTPAKFQPLWQILLKATNLGEDAILNCDECFSILEYLAETTRQIEGDINLFYQIARRHLSRCPDCREYYLAQLDQLEKSRQTTAKSNQESPIIS